MGLDRRRIPSETAMAQERSAGAVVAHVTNSTPEYLLLHYAAGHWDFPKGNVERGERLEETVRREIREETGIREVTFVPGFRKLIEYYYRRANTRVHKEVVFYLVLSTSRAVRISHEHLAYSWLPYEAALRRLTYENAKSVLAEAHGYLHRHATSMSSLNQFLRPTSSGENKH